jgi:alkylhydroperoxidase family enzyme
MSTTIAPIELDAARRAESDDPHVAALLKLSNAIAENAGDVPEADIALARAAGVTDEEISEVVANLAFNTLTNYFNVLASVRNDWPAVRL